ncbi:MAG: histidine--tRNA ligase [Actinobacteria bacterium]|nr:histidine--tRNA ligase [Actinomycetota bacterium]MSX81236.1 histidine--tRNA ligase [Actinomycetota bacterium]
MTSVSSDPAFRAPIGVHDVLPPESGRWADVVTRFARRAGIFGFGLIQTPLFEHIEVFRRVGEHTDVVSKEMYEFRDKGDRHLALRPEGTASVVRAYVQHRPLPPWKVWYFAPNFRYERPQKGRYRQHWQLGVEVLGLDDPAIDIEVIALAAGFYRDLGLRDLRLIINSMGDPEGRGAYVEALRSHLLTSSNELGPEFVERVEANPLRVLDSRNPEWQSAIESAPLISNHLSPDASAHFEAVKAGLNALGIEFEVDGRLVRGFDYYTRTTFEFQSTALDAAQNAVGGGGRYDGLAEAMGGPPTPGIGFGIGVERLLLALDAEEVISTSKGNAPSVFVIDGLSGTDELLILAVTSGLREAGISTERAYGGRSLKAQWKAADRCGARYGVMIGKAELERDSVVVKDLETGEQIEVRRDQLVAWIRESFEENYQ